MNQRIKSCPQCHTISKIADTHPNCRSCGTSLFPNDESMLKKAIDSTIKSIKRREIKEKKNDDFYQKLLSGEIEI